jgi:multiple sugar transport system ATP-binding protein
MNFVTGKIEGDGIDFAIRFADDTRLTLPGNRQGTLAPLVGKDVVLGVRPQHFRRETTNISGSQAGRIDATVELIQPTGSRSFVTFKLGGMSVMAELPAHEVGEVGAMLPLQIDVSRAVLIDPATDRVI